MSRIGTQPIAIPDGVKVEIGKGTIAVKGKKGSLSQTFSPEMQVEQKDGRILVAPIKKQRRLKPLWGLTRALINNMVVGVSEGFSKNLQIVGVGYRAAVQGSTLKLSLGFSHDVMFPIPDGIKIKVDKNTNLTVEGSDPQLVGQVCADIRRYRPPEPYKGKGVRYADEHVSLKEGKKK